MDLKISIDYHEYFISYANELEAEHCRGNLESRLTGNEVPMSPDMSSSLKDQSTTSRSLHSIPKGYSKVVGDASEQLPEFNNGGLWTQSKGKNKACKIEKDKKEKMTKQSNGIEQATTTRQKHRNHSQKMSVDEIEVSNQCLSKTTESSMFDLEPETHVCTLSLDELKKIPRAKRNKEENRRFNHLMYIRMESILV